MTRRKPLGATHGVAFATVRDGGDDGWHIECRFEDGQKYAPITVDHDNEPLADAIAGFLNSKTPPPDAEVREAVEVLERLRDPHISAGENFKSGDLYKSYDATGTLLRAVQAPRLTGEQREALKNGVDFFDNYARMKCSEQARALAAQLRAAFGLGEVGE